jgi:hypothetical protein
VEASRSCSARRYRSTVPLLNDLGLVAHWRLTLGSRAFQSYIRVHATGLTFLGISQRTIAKFPFELPPIPEQRQMAAILDTVDDAIRKPSRSSPS